MKCVVYLTVLVGCVNARESFDDFGDRVPDAAPSIDSEIISNLPDVTGEFYTVANLVNTDRYFRFITTHEFTPVTENTGLLDSSHQPLDHETLEPVGAPLVSEGVEVRSDGRADLPLIGLLPARANSITGTDVQLNAIIHAQIRTTDFICGDLTGQAATLPVDGSTFGSGRIQPPGDVLPAMIARCADGP